MSKNYIERFYKVTKEYDNEEYKALYFNTEESKKLKQINQDGDFQRLIVALEKSGIDKRKNFFEEEFLDSYIWLKRVGLLHKKGLVVEPTTNSSTNYNNNIERENKLKRLIDKSERYELKLKVLNRHILFGRRHFSVENKNINELVELTEDNKKEKQKIKRVRLRKTNQQLEQNYLFGNFLLKLQHGDANLNNWPLYNDICSQYNLIKQIIQRNANFTFLDGRLLPYYNNFASIMAKLVLRQITYKTEEVSYLETIKMCRQIDPKSFDLPTSISEKEQTKSKWVKMFELMMKKVLQRQTEKYETYKRNLLDRLVYKNTNAFHDEIVSAEKSICYVLNRMDSLKRVCLKVNNVLDPIKNAVCEANESTCELLKRVKVLTSVETEDDLIRQVEKMNKFETNSFSRIAQGGDVWPARVANIQNLVGKFEHLDSEELTRLKKFDEIDRIAKKYNLN